MRPGEPAIPFSRVPVAGDRACHEDIFLRLTPIEEKVEMTSLGGSDNPSVEEAVRVFCEVWMAEQQFSEVTRRGYRYDLAEWLSHVSYTQVRSLSTRTIQRYFQHLESKGLQDSTRKRKTAALATFLRFLAEQGILTEDMSSSLIWPDVEPQGLIAGQRGEVAQSGA